MPEPERRASPGRLIGRASEAPVMLARRREAPPAAPAELPAGARPKRDAPPAMRTCADCANRAPAGTCAEPVAAGLIEAAAGFGLAWGDDKHAATCAAFEAKAPTKPQDRPYRLTQAEGNAAHADEWDDATIARFRARVATIRRRGFTEQDAEDLAERLHLRDVHADHRALCLECRHLAGTAATGWRCGNHRAADVARDLPAAQVTMPQDCPGFKGTAADTDRARNLQ